LKEYKDNEKSFVKQTRLVKKQKIKIEFEKKDYVASLKRILDVINGKCTIYMVKKHSIISEYNHIAF